MTNDACRPEQLQVSKCECSHTTVSTTSLHLSPLCSNTGVSEVPAICNSVPPPLLKVLSGFHSPWQGRRCLLWPTDPPHHLWSKHNLLQEASLNSEGLQSSWREQRPMSLPTLSPTLRSDPRCAKAAASAQNSQNSSRIQDQSAPSPSPLLLSKQLSTTCDLLTRKVRELKRN